MIRIPNLKSEPTFKVRHFLVLACTFGLKRPVVQYSKPASVTSWSDWANSGNRTRTENANNQNNFVVLTVILLRKETQRWLNLWKFFTWVQISKQMCQITVLSTIHIKRRCSGQWFDTFFLEIWTKLKIVSDIMLSLARSSSQSQFT